jgi:amidophosphoribosyltransferase
MSELNHECGIAAIYHLPGDPHPFCPEGGPEEISRLLPRMLLDIQNRGQLAAGMTSYNPGREQLLDTHKDIGTVSEVFRLSHRGKAESLMRQYAGRAAIGHVRYATCGEEDRNYAQPFERHHLEKRKWFSFGFNGQLANYQILRQKLLSDADHHLARDNDTEIIMHEISRELSGDRRPRLVDVMRSVSRRFDGAYSIVYLSASGDMLIARDPLGIKPLCYAKDGALFAAASESVPLLNLGFSPEQIHSLPPGHAITITNGVLEVERFAESPRSAHCYFEWIYFANVASTLDERSVYLSRTALGEELARLEREDGSVPIDENTIVVPVPDTSKAAADAMAHKLGIPSREGLIRNLGPGAESEHDSRGDNSDRCPRPADWRGVGEHSGLAVEGHCVLSDRSACRRRSGRSTHRSHDAGKRAPAPTNRCISARTWRRRHRLLRQCLDAAYS